MEPWKRCAIGYGVASIAFPLMAESLKQNGGAYPGNPAWVLISTIRNILIGSWVLLALGFAIWHWWTESEKAHAEWERKEKERKETEQDAIQENRTQHRWMERKIEELERRAEKTDLLVRALESKIEESKKPKVEAPSLVFEPEADSIQLALEDFG